MTCERDLSFESELIFFVLFGLKTELQLLGNGFGPAYFIMAHLTAHLMERKEKGGFAPGF